MSEYYKVTLTQVLECLYWQALPLSATKVSHSMRRLAPGKYIDSKHVRKLLDEGVAKKLIVHSVYRRPGYKGPTNRKWDAFELAPGQTQVNSSELK